MPQHVAQGTMMAREGAAWGPLNRSKTKGFFKCQEPNLNKNKDLYTGKVCRSEVLTTLSLSMYREGSWVLGNHLLLALCLLSPTTSLSQRNQSHLPSCFETVILVTSSVSLGWYLWIFLSCSPEGKDRWGEYKGMILCNSRELKTILHLGKK